MAKRMRFSRLPPYSSVRWFGLRVEELVDQEAVRAVDLDDVEAGGVGARRGLAPVFGEFAGSPSCPARAAPATWRRPAARSARPAPRRPSRRSPGAARAACRPPRGGRCATCVPNGRAGCRPAAPQACTKSTMRRSVRHEGVVPQPEVADRAAAAALDLGRLDEEQARAAGGEAPGVHHVPVGGKALDARVLVHRRDHDAVLERQRRGS